MCTDKKVTMRNEQRRGRSQASGRKSRKWSSERTGPTEKYLYLISGLSSTRTVGYGTCTRRSPAGLFRWNALATSACT